jgi:hypothetical protein
VNKMRIWKVTFSYWYFDKQMGRAYPANVGFSPCSIAAPDLLTAASEFNKLTESEVYREYQDYLIEKIELVGGVANEVHLAP